MKYLDPREVKRMADAQKSLKPCPCCGSAAVMQHTSAGYSVRCSQEFCGVRTKACGELESAVGIWSARGGVPDGGTWAGEVARVMSDEGYVVESIQSEGCSWWHMRLFGVECPAYEDGPDFDRCDGCPLRTGDSIARFLRTEVSDGR